MARVIQVDDYLLIDVPAKLEEIADLIRGYHRANPVFVYKDYVDAFAQDHGIKIGYVVPISFFVMVF